WLQEIPDSAYYDPEIVPPGAEPDDVLSREIFIAQNANGSYRLLAILPNLHTNISTTRSQNFSIGVIGHDSELNQVREQVTAMISFGETLRYQVDFGCDGTLVLQVVSADSD